MKKQLAVLAAAIAVSVVALPMAPASASSVCAPITVDGQPVCQDITPVEQAIAQAEWTVANAVPMLLAEYMYLWNTLAPVTYPTGAEFNCEVRGAPAPSLTEVDVEVVTPSADGMTCDGVDLSVVFGQVLGSGSSQHVHVPQICLTTTGTCLGPIDRDIATPNIGGVDVCAQPVHLVRDQYNSTVWTRTYSGPKTCVPNPTA